jgi:hypothetical protein
LCSHLCNPQFSDYECVLSLFFSGFILICELGLCTKIQREGIVNRQSSIDNRRKPESVNRFRLPAERLTIHDSRFTCFSLFLCKAQSG